jgi:nucleotide-binding universal stress UspA family protein
MYRRILVAVENSPADRTILAHVGALAKLTGAELLLVHVADGFAARHFNDLQLRESDEMRDDRAYLARRTDELQKAGLQVSSRLAMGDPATEIIKIASQEGVDLIAMSTHGHRFLSDLIHGTTVDKVRHTVRVPVLLLRAPRHEAD